MTVVAQKRRRALGMIVVLAVASAAIGFLAGRTVKSPADAAADAEPPEASLITVPVELRELASNVIVRGDAVLEGSVEVGIDASAGLNSGGIAVVTATTAAEGDVVEEGAVLMEVAERPVIGLQGELPMFRSLGPGSRGDDVAQVQQALTRLGFDTPVDGVYGEATERAVEAMYTAIGYTAPGITDDEKIQLDAARESVDAAQSQLNATSASLAELQAPLPRSTLLQADASLESAKSAVTLAEAAETEANAIAAADVASLIVERTAAAEAAVVAAARLTEAEGGTHPDTGLAPTADELAALEAEAVAADEVAASAAAAVTAAEASAAVIATQQAEFVADAKTQLEIAEAQHDELLAPPDTSAAAQAVADARRARDAARSDLTDLEARTGIRLPLAEIVFVRSMPTRVQRLHVERGDIVGGGSVMTVSGAEVTLESAVSASDRPLLTEGAIVRIDDDSLGIDIEGEITFLADEPGGRAPDGRYFMRITPSDTAGADIAGLNLRVTIPITSTGGEVLTVPLAALAAGGDGSVRVEVEDPTRPGTTRVVVVTTGLETTGFVEVRAVEGDLAVGDRVVIGQQ